MTKPQIPILGTELRPQLLQLLPAALDRGYPDSHQVAHEWPTDRTRSGRISVRPPELEALIRHANPADDLVGVIEALSGVIQDKAAQRSEEERAWNEIFSNMENELGASPEALLWIAALRDSRLIRRLAKHDIERGRLLCDEAIKVTRRLPASGEYLAEIAAIGAGDGHALDPGRPLSAILLRYVSKLSGIDDWRTVEGRRSAWAGVGVLVDELSAPVLTLNLRSENDNNLGRALNMHADAGESYRITTRQLLRSTFNFTKSSVGPRVYVCENPTVVAAAAKDLAEVSAPLICIEGQPKTSAHILLLQLRRAGVELAYHGDFDWPGIQIANLIIQRYAAVPWRLCAPDYEDAATGIKLKGKPVLSCWDPELSTRMTLRQAAIHEEAVLALLLKDLGSDAGRSSSAAS